MYPAEIKKDINPYSGFVSPKSKYGKKNLKGLFLCPENKKYLTQKLFALITNIDFVKKNIPTDYDYTPMEWDSKRMVDTFKTKKSLLDTMMQDMIEVHPLHYDEEKFVDNPIVQLDRANREFLLQSGRNLVQNPETLAPRYFAVTPYGTDESKVEWDFTSESYSDGTWHPEHLFTNSQRNRDTPYWQPLEVSFFSEPDAEGLGHRYYNHDGPDRATGLYAHNQRTRSQFPRWQDAGAREQYDHANEESLREGGQSDRRVQRNRGYNMTNLITKSTY